MKEVEPGRPILDMFAPLQSELVQGQSAGGHICVLRVTETQRRLSSNRDPLDLIEGDLVTRAIIKLRCSWTLVRGHRLRVFERATGFEIRRDPRGAECMAADRD